MCTINKYTILISCTYFILALSCSRKESEQPAGIEVPAGFEVEVAAGPDLVDYPMFATVDETGRLFVFESTGNVYEENEDAINHPQFRINLLEDINGDGVYDKSTIYAGKVGFPQGGVFYKGSLYASSAPDLLKFTDTNDDGVADKREVLLSGWTLNINANSLIGPFIAPDGWLYLTSAIEGFDITTKEGEHLKGETSRVWRVRTDGTELQWVSAGGMNNPVGLTFTSASEPLGTQTYFTDPKAGQRDALMYWTEGGVYPKPNSNITRDKLPLTGDLLPVVTKYSRVAPAGISRYRSHILGDDFYNNLFSAQFNTHRVMRHKLTRDGASFRTEDEIFFASTNEDFHPTDVLEDGDGSLLIVETGGWFIKGCPLSQVSKPELQGSIYRVRRKDAPEVDDPFGNNIKWSSITTPEAISLLDDARPYIADRAVNWLVDQGQSAASILTEHLKKSSSSLSRTRIVFALYRINTNESIASLREALNDTDLEVRVAAARCSGLAKDKGSIDRLLEMVQRDEPAAKRQAATALGQIGEARVVPSLLKAANGVTDRFIDHAIIYALISINQPEQVAKALSDPSQQIKKTALIVLDQMKNSSLTAQQLTPFLTGKDSLLQSTSLWVVSHHPEWASEMTSYVRTRLNEKELSTVEKNQLKEILVTFCGNAAMQQLMAQQLAGTSQERKLFILDAMAASQLKEVPESWITSLGNALTTNNDLSVKLNAIKLVRLHGIKTLSTSLQQVSGNQQNPDALRISATGALLESDSLLSEEQFNYLYDQLQPGHAAPIRQQAASVLAQGTLSKPQVLKIANEFLPNADAFILPRLMPIFKGATDIDIGKALTTALATSSGLDNFSEDYIREMFSGYPAELNTTTEKLITKLKGVHAERLDHIHAIENNIPKGDIERGRILFFSKAICYTCHSIGNEGGTYGPDLTSIQRDRSTHDLVEAIVYPSVSFVREFETYRIKTKDNTFTGIIQEETGDMIVLGLSPQESVQIQKKEIVSNEIDGASMMPQSLDKLLTEQEMADLMAFIIGQDQDPETDAELLR